ncbi:hypothetical protein IG631_17038 [Alternaria alternata]|nr:hypothetical protein IG631_17038 [Alternaria alternata]
MVGRGHLVVIMMVARTLSRPVKVFDDRNSMGLSALWPIRAADATESHDRFVDRCRACATVWSVKILAKSFECKV